MQEENSIARTAALLQRVQALYPHLGTETVRLISEGAFNELLVVDETYIFRFPRTAEGVQRLRTELVVLRALQGRTTLPIPDPLFVSPNMYEVGQAFIGYEMIPGVPLREHLAALAGKHEIRHLADQLAAFLRELHAVPLQAVAGDLPVHDQSRRASLSIVYESIRRDLHPLMHESARATVAEQFDVFLSAPPGPGYELAIKHGDLGPGNILFDAEARAVSGIVDWGSTGLDDPAFDVGYVSLWGGFYLGEAFVARFHASYGVTPSLLGRARFFETLLALLVALDGLRTDDQEALAFGLARYT
ncbi:MAG: phosphotransferase family protein [Anaerolineae bacterium]